MIEKREEKNVSLTSNKKLFVVVILFLLIGFYSFFLDFWEVSSNAGEAGDSSSYDDFVTLSNAYSNKSNAEEEEEEEIKVQDDLKEEKGEKEPMSQKYNENLNKFQVDITKDISKPILNIGMPDVASLSLFDYFQCGGYKTSHTTCVNKQKCGAMIQLNLEMNHKTFEDYDVYTKLYHGCFFPQVYVLTKMHDMYPYSTFILPLRNSTEWIAQMRKYHKRTRDSPSTSNYFTTPKCFEDLPDKNLTMIYESHTKAIYDFVKKHPSHTLVVVHLDNPTSSQNILKKYFGLKDSCWTNNNVEGAVETLSEEVSIEPEDIDITNTSTNSNSNTTLALIKPKISFPVIVVGLPKSGTTSLYNYFVCGGLKTSHWRCKTEDTLCSIMIKRNIRHKLPPLYNTGNYEVYAQVDGYGYCPQNSGMQEIHEAYPNATFVLNLRNASSWAQSTMHWESHPSEGIKNKYGKASQHKDRNRTEEKLIQNYHGHTKRIEQFVEKFPSHSLIKVKIDDDAAPYILEQAFGISKNCWGMANVNKDLH